MKGPGKWSNFFFKFNFFLVFVFRNYFWLYKCLTNIISTLQDASPKNSSTYHCLIRLNHYELKRVFQLGKNCHMPCVSSPARAKLAPAWSLRLPWKRGKFAKASKTHTGSDKFCCGKIFHGPAFRLRGTRVTVQVFERQSVQKFVWSRVKSTAINYPAVTTPYKGAAKIKGTWLLGPFTLRQREICVPVKPLERNNFAQSWPTDQFKTYFIFHMVDAVPPSARSA